MPALESAYRNETIEIETTIDGEVIVIALPRPLLGAYLIG